MKILMLKDLMVVIVLRVVLQWEVVEILLVAVDLVVADLEWVQDNNRIIRQ